MTEKKIFIFDPNSSKVFDTKVLSFRYKVAFQFVSALNDVAEAFNQNNVILLFISADIEEKFLADTITYLKTSYPSIPVIFYTTKEIEVEKETFYKIDSETIIRLPIDVKELDSIVTKYTKITPEIKSPVIFDRRRKDRRLQERRRTDRRGTDRRLSNYRTINGQPLIVMKKTKLSYAIASILISAVLFAGVMYRKQVYTVTNLLYDTYFDSKDSNETVKYNTLKHGLDKLADSMDSIMKSIEDINKETNENINKLYAESNKKANIQVVKQNIKNEPVNLNIKDRILNLIKNHNIDEAEKIYNNNRELLEEDNDIIKKFAYALYDRENYSRAIIYMKQANKLSDYSDPHLLLRTAVAYSQINREFDSILLYEIFINDFPTHPAVLEVKKFLNDYHKKISYANQRVRNSIREKLMYHLEWGVDFSLGKNINYQAVQLNNRIVNGYIPERFYDAVKTYKNTQKYLDYLKKNDMKDREIAILLFRLKRKLYILMKKYNYSESNIDRREIESILDQPIENLPEYYY